MILYRPVGLQELELIYDSGMKAFPARLPQQPIFYPVLDLEYARQTASDWNAKSGQAAGYVTQFKVEDQYIAPFEKHTVGGSQHQEFWIPAEELEKFNQHITGHIKVVEAHFGEAFQGFVPEQFALQGKNAVEQFTLIANSYLYQRMDFYREIKRNHKAIFLNYPFWQKYEFKNPGLKAKVIQAIREAWLTSFPNIPLVTAAPENIPPVKQIDPQSLAEVDGDDTQPAEETDTQSLMNDPDEDVKPVKPTVARSFVKPVQAEILPLKKPYSQSLVDPVDEDAPFIKPADEQVQPFVKPVREDAAPVKQTDRPSWANRVREHQPPVKPTTSPFSRGIELGLKGEVHEAIDELTRAVAEAPSDVIARTSLGVAFHRLGEDDRALSCYEAALKLDPNNAEAHYFRANCLYAQGNIREAIAGYTIAFGLKPELIHAHEESLPQDRLTDYSPAPAEMHRIARPARRILELNRSLEDNPSQANLLKERAAEYYRLWNYEQAVADYSSSLAVQPEDAEALHFRGVAYEQLRQFDRALEDYQQAAAIDPQLSDAYLNRGVKLGGMGQFRQSIDSLNEGIRLAPNNPDGYFNRGMSYFQLDEFENAIADFSIVIQLSPQDEAAYYWRGISNEAAGRREEAIADYTQFLKVSQDSSAREEVEQRLSQWHAGTRSAASSRRILPADRKKTDRLLSAQPDRGIDLYDLIAALGERALRSTWLGRGVNCFGEKAEELYALTDRNQPIQGRALLEIASGIRQTREGDFHAFDPSATTHWLFIRAWEGSGFYIETNDPRNKQRLKAQFPSLEEVEGATPPFESLFLSV